MNYARFGAGRAQLKRLISEVEGDLVRAEDSTRAALDAARKLRLAESVGELVGALRLILQARDSLISLRGDLRNSPGECTR